MKESIKRIHLIIVFNYSKINNRIKGCAENSHTRVIRTKMCLFDCV